MAQCEAWAIFTFSKCSVFWVCSHRLYVFLSAGSVFVCVHVVLRVRVSMCLWCLHMPAVCPRSVIKTKKGWMLFCYEFFTLLLASQFPPTVSGCLALIRQHLGRHWRRHFKQPRPQQFKCISHQELSIRYAIPPVFVTAAFIVIHSVYIAYSHTDKAAQHWYWWVS